MSKHNKKEKLTDKKVAEIIQERYDSESYHELTPEQIKRSEEIAKKVEEYGRKLYGRIGWEIKNNKTN